MSDKKEKIVVGNKLRRILIKENMTQQTFAQISGLSTSVIQKICQDKRNHVSLPIALTIAQTLLRPVEQVFFLKKAPKKDEK